MNHRIYSLENIYICYENDFWWTVPEYYAKICPVSELDNFNKIIRTIWNFFSAVLVQSQFAVLEIRSNVHRNAVSRRFFHLDRWFAICAEGCEHVAEETRAVVTKENSVHLNEFGNEKSIMVGDRVPINTRHLLSIGGVRFFENLPGRREIKKRLGCTGLNVQVYGYSVVYK